MREINQFQSTCIAALGFSEEEIKQVAEAGPGQFRSTLHPVKFFMDIVRNQLDANRLFPIDREGGRPESWEEIGKRFTQQSLENAANATLERIKTNMLEEKTAVDHFRANLSQYLSTISKAAHQYIAARTRTSAEIL